MGRRELGIAVATLAFAGMGVVATLSALKISDEHAEVILVVLLVVLAASLFMTFKEGKPKMDVVAAPMFDIAGDVGEADLRNNDSGRSNILRAGGKLGSISGDGNRSSHG